MINARNVSVKPRGRPEIMWKEIVDRDVTRLYLNKEDAVTCSDLEQASGGGESEWISLIMVEWFTDVVMTWGLKI